MLKFCRNFCSIFNDTCLRIVMKYDLMGLSIASSQIPTNHFLRFLLTKSDTIRYVPLTYHALCSSTNPYQEAYIMPKRKRPQHHSRERENVHGKREKYHRSHKKKSQKHSRKKRKSSACKRREIATIHKNIEIASKKCESRNHGLNTVSKQKEHKLKVIRHKVYTEFGSTMINEEQEKSCPQHLIFDVLSYNVLSQSILEDHRYLYKDHHPGSLDWQYRSELLLKEFQEFNAEILCLQEVQRSHLQTFYSKLFSLGYDGVYKQRTGNKVDGVAIYYKKNVFNLTDYGTVEYCQPGTDILNRDNVGLIAKLAPKMNPQERIVVATTHLLFNPNRHDIKLAQIQLLLAEVERFAFKGFDGSTGNAQYWPVILTGDMNFEPHAGVYKLLTMGMFEYKGLNRRTLVGTYGPLLQNELLPHYLGITDTCQHWGILVQRQLQILDHVAERSALKIFNSDYMPTKPQFESYWADQAGNSENFNCVTYQGSIPWCSGPNMKNYGFGTGKLSHCLNLKSVYLHDPDNVCDTSQVSTHQNTWVLVDYMFYSSVWQPYLQKCVEDKLKLVARYRLLSKAEAEVLGPIPNRISPSDHYPLCARFALVL